MAGNAARQGYAADGHLDQAEDPATTQALAHHHHAAGQGADAFPALHVLFGRALEGGGFDTLDAFEFAHGLSPGFSDR
ncbi:hypothetical protein D3C73_1438900 [compost metagenome]